MLLKHNSKLLHEQAILPGFASPLAFILHLLLPGGKVGTFGQSQSEQSGKHTECSAGIKEVSPAVCASHMLVEVDTCDDQVSGPAPVSR